MKIFLKLDPKTVTGAFRDGIINRMGSEISLVAHDVHIFTFDPAQYTHAQWLLSLNPANYGKDLSIYISNTITHFNRTDPDREISLQMGDSDFKRKMSEDLGVGIAGLFMNVALGVDWRSIVQVPQNKKLASTRPDFQGTDSGGELYLFEAKGTTGLKTHVTQISHGLDQVKKYPVNSARKLLLASYFSGEESSFPSTAFVIDPPSTVSPLDTSQAIKLHYWHVLRFLNCFEQANAYRDLLAVDFSIEKKDRSWQYQPRYTKVQRRFIMEMSRVPNFVTEETRNGTYMVIRDQIEANGELFAVTRGIAKTVLDSIVAFDKGYSTVGETKIDPDGTSYFSDGTMFRLEKLKQ